MLPISKKQALERILARASRGHLNISDHGLRFIALWEGLNNNLYNDDGQPSSISEGNATIGVGHLVHYGPVDGRPEEAPFANGLSNLACLTLLRRDAASVEQAVSRTIYAPLNQDQFDALCDFTFNCGDGALVNISNIVNRKGNVCAVISTYVNPPWATEALTRRRNDECALFNTVPSDEEEPMTQTEKEAFDNLFRAHADLQVQVSALANGSDAVNKGALRYLWALAAKRWPWPA